MVILLLVIGLVFAVSVYIAVYEAWAEKDWPRETGKFVVWSGLTLLIGLASVGF